MAKRKRELIAEGLDPVPNTSLQNHPLTFLIPTDLVVPFTLPHDTNIPSDTIVFSQDDFNEQRIEESILTSDLWKLEDPDLKYVKFKKPYLNNYTIYNPPPDAETEQSHLNNYDELDPSLLNITPITKKDYLKINIPVQEYELTTSLNDKIELVDRVVDMFAVDIKDDNLLDVSKIKSDPELESSNMKPEFDYDSKVTQTVLLSQAKNEFIDLVTKLAKPYKTDENPGHSINEKDDDDEDDDDLYNKYITIFSDETNIARSEILGILKLKLINMIESKTQDSIDMKIYSDLLTYCVDVIKESLVIEWELIYQSKEIYNTSEYHDFAKAVFQACSILVVLYANNLTEMLTSSEKGLGLIIDVITTFGSTFKLLYKQETFAEIPDFFIPAITQLGQMLIMLGDNFRNLPLDESLITKLEYVSLDIIFVDIIFSKERLNLNSSLEDLRALFADIIILIYFKYEDQRLFLLNEIVENVATLNPLKSKAKNHRLKSGVSIQLTSFLIISLLQCHHSFGKDFDFLQWEVLTMNYSTKAKAIELKEIEDHYWNSIYEQVISLNKTTNIFVHSFFKKIVSTYTPNLKKIIENFISDFIIMLELPEFPVASILLNSIISCAFNLCETTENSLATSYALFFEIIGITASKILSIKHESKVIILSADTDIHEFTDISAQYFMMLSYYKFSTSTDKYMVPFKLLSLLFLSKLKHMESEINLIIINSEKDVLIGDKLKEKKKLLKEVKSQMSKIMELPFQDKCSVDLELLSEAKIYEIQKSIFLSQDLVMRYDDILSFIVRSLDNPKIKSRALAVKNLTLLINKEPTLLEDIKLRAIVKQRLNEQSATVIDSILDLLLKVLECKPEFIDEYYDIVAQKITDPSVNVKRKSVGLIRFMFLHTDEDRIKVRLCQALLSQLDDEDDRIIDLACLRLCELLFMNLKNDSDEEDLISMEMQADNTNFILSGIFSLGSGTWRLFERFLNEKVIYQSDFNKNFSKELSVSLHLLVNSMLSLITDSNDKLDDNKDVSIESIMGVLTTFVKFDQTLISQHQLISLQPYIIDNYNSTNICFYALRILNLALDHYKTLNKNFIGSCKESIMKRLTKFKSKELDQAVQCAWKLFSIDNNTTCISKACISSIKLLLNSINQTQYPSKNIKPDPVIPRLLFLIGNFGRYCKFENDRELFTNAKIGLSDNEPIPVLLLKYLLKFCDSSVPAQLRKLAIKNTLNICISYPKLFFSVPVSSLIGSSFKAKDLEVTNIIIGAFLIFLEDEETRMVKRNGLDSKRSNHIKLDVAVFHGYSLEYVNDGICSTLVQKYIHPILETCLEEDIENSLNSIKFLRMVLKFGFSNPKICFPTVVALECAKSSYIRHIAIESHRFMFDKFETLIESTYSEALKTTIKYITVVYKLNELCGCKKFLRTFMKIVRERKSRQSIEKFIYAIIRALGNISLHKFQKMNKRELKVMEFQIVFLSININEIEFLSQFEILTVINCIEKIMLAEENIFGDQFNLLMDMFDDDDDADEKLKYLVMAKALLCLNCLTKCLIANYSISPELILRFQEINDKKDFRTAINRSEYNQFFNGEIKDLLTKNASNQLTLLHNKLIEFGKN